MDRRRSVVINGKTTFSQRSDSNSLLHQHLQRRCMAEESREAGACTVSASKEDSDDVAGSGFGKRHLFCQTVDGSTKAANDSNRLIGDRSTEFVRNGYRIVPPDHCAEIAAGCKLVVKAAIDDHECFALADFPVHNAGQVNACLAHEPADRTSTRKSVGKGKSGSVRVEVGGR